MKQPAPLAPPIQTTILGALEQMKKAAALATAFQYLKLTNQQVN